MWFWLWLLFLLVLFLLPLGYGWGYRRWGPPYPSYYRRRRVATGPAITGSGWGWAGDLLWIVLVVALVWLLVALVV